MKTLILYLLLLTTSLCADFWKESDIERVAKEPTWLNLLHYDSSGSQSAIHDKRFFLDSKGQRDAKRELLATLKAYGEPFNDKERDEHAQCRFPARYLWLSTQFTLPNYNELNPACDKLLKWKLLKGTQSISVVFVSGYLGNPASAFGHSFIKVNQSNNEEDNLFDTTLSYGALLPPKYNMPEYIFNGLTGGYEAAYSDKYYYNQDITYSNQEFRDMWEYRLKLSDAKRKLFLFHAWELMGKKNQYFFLNRNCGYKVSEFLSLLYEKPLIDSAYVWYSPIETFYKLKEMDEKGAGEIIDKVIYIPSKQQIIYAQYRMLTTLEKKMVSEMIEKKLNQIPIEYQDVNKSLQAHVLDFLLAYRKYSFEKSKIKIDKDIKAFNRSLLLNRLKLPASRGQKGKPKIKEPITENNAPRYFGMSFLTQESDDALALHFAPFAIEKVGYNNFSGDELVVLDTTVKMGREKVSLNKFDLIRIQRLKTKQIPYDEESSLSWNLHIGTQENENRDYFIDGGLGYAWELTNHMKFYTMMNLSLHSDEKKYRYMPNIGLYGDFHHLRVDLKAGYENELMKENPESIFVLNGQYRMHKHLSLFLQYDNIEMEYLSLGLKWFY